MGILRRYLPLAVLITCLAGLIFLSGQQIFRLNANDPQIQLAKDTATQLSTQSDTVQITALPRIDISTSLTPFEIIYNADGKAISSTGILNGKIPELPTGVLAYTKEHTENRFTWQPKPGVRIAAVARHFTGRTNGYILAGRSLIEIESRIDALQEQIAIGWLLTLAATFLAVLVTSVPPKKKK
ncbi:hypothetical protein BH09PAT1_BH09PAT1_0170 [soil metagenome]